MRQHFAYFALLVYLLNTPLGASLSGEVVKIPFLLRHFREHRNEQPDISFPYFLAMHYWANSPAHSAQHSHEKLPFKGDSHTHHAGHCFLDGYAFVEEQRLWVLFLPLADAHNGKPVFETEDYHSLSLFDIFQPPKV